MTSTSTADGRWESEFRRGLARHNPPPALPGEVAREVRTAVRETGQDAETLFGDPAAYADLIAEERVSARRRGLVDLAGHTAGGLLRQNVARVLEWFAAILVVSWVFGQATHEYNWRLLLAYLVIGVEAATLYGLVPSLRVGGRPRTSWAVAAGSILCSVVAVGVLTALRDPGETPVEVPAAATIGGIIVLDLLWRLLPHRLTDRVATPSHDLDDETWPRRLDALLRGRHAVPLRTAAAMVTETREHQQTTGRGFEELFGPVEIHARSLAERVPVSSRRARLRILFNCAFGAIALGYLVVGVLTGSPAVIGVFGTCLLVLAGHSLALWWGTGRTVITEG